MAQAPGLRVFSLAVLPVMCALLNYPSCSAVTVSLLIPSKILSLDAGLHSSFRSGCGKGGCNAQGLATSLVLPKAPISPYTHAHSAPHTMIMLISQNVIDIPHGPHPVRQTFAYGTAGLTGSVGTGPAPITAPHCSCISSSLCATDPVLQSETIRARKKTGLPRDDNTCTIPCSGPCLNDAPVVGADPASKPVSTSQKSEAN